MSPRTTGRGAEEPRSHRGRHGEGGWSCGRMRQHGGRRDGGTVKPGRGHGKKMLRRSRRRTCTKTLDVNAATKSSTERGVFRQSHRLNRPIWQNNLTPWNILFFSYAMCEIRTKHSKCKSFCFLSVTKKYFFFNQKCDAVNKHLICPFFSQPALLFWTSNKIFLLKQM